MYLTISPEDMMVMLVSAERIRLLRETEDTEGSLSEDKRLFVQLDAIEATLIALGLNALKVMPNVGIDDEVNKFAERLMELMTAQEIIDPEDLERIEDESDEDFFKRILGAEDDE